MTIKEIIQRIQSLYSKGVQSDDTRLSSRHIFNKLNTARSLLIKRQADKNQISDSDFQYVNCIKVIKASLHECPCVPQLGCCFYRTECKIPSILNGKNKELIESLTSLDSGTQFSQWEWKEFKWKRGEKYTKFKPDFFFKDGYIFFTQRNSIQERYVTLKAVFDNPLDGYIFSNEKGCDPQCIDYFELEYPITGSLIDGVVEMTVKELIQIFNSSIEDSTNDTRDNITTQTK